MSVPAKVIEPEDALRCAAALNYALRHWPNGLDQGDLASIQAAFLVAGQSAQSLQLGPLTPRMSRDGTATDDQQREELLDIVSAAELAGVNRRTIRRRLDRGELCPVVVGGRRFVRRAELERGQR